MKKFIAVLAVFVLMTGVVIYVFRGEIFQYSADAILKKSLPDYMIVDQLTIDYDKGVLYLKGLGIRNPPGYAEDLLARVGTISCSYKMLGKSIPEGIEITAISADDTVINIERRRDGRMNINEMEQVMSGGGSTGGSPSRAAGVFNKAKGGKDISELIKVTDTVNINNGKVIFRDAAVSYKPVEFTFEEVNGSIRIDMTDDFHKVLAVSSQGGGVVNGDRSQRIEWAISLDPLRSALTMSNRFEVRGVSLREFKPYYDRYSPIDIKRGTFSGSLVFDFDGGNIGSMNTVRLNNLQFSIKEDGSGSNFWETTVPDLVKYLQSAPGEITFDFKIKGDMKNPRFYPGPIVSKAIANMTVDKISQMLEQGSGQQSQGGGAAPQGEMSDAEKAMEAIKALLKK